VSLLLDALRKAEDQKLKQSGEAPAEARAPPTDTAAVRKAARQMFAAKEPTPPPSGRHRFAMAIGGGGLLAALALGGWFWWQLQARDALAALPPPATTPAPTPLPTPSSVAIAPAPAAFLPPVPPASTFFIAPEPAEVAEAPPPPPARNDPGSDVPPAALAKALPAAEASPIRVASARKKPDTTLLRAWEAFNRGEFTLARLSWQKALAADPHNSHALHGLAALAMQQERPDEAAEYYLRALAADPGDALALAGLALLRTHTDHLQTESQLKVLIARQPESPHLHFALGNLYASSARWADAQQSFFRAHVSDPTNPDYLFNLAVSLDQLRQPRLAALHYQRALTAAKDRPPGFDPAKAQARLKALTGE